MVQDVLVVGGFRYRPPFVLIAISNHFDLPLTHARKFPGLDKLGNSFGVFSRIFEDSTDTRRLFLLLERSVNTSLQIVDIDKPLIQMAKSFHFSYHTAFRERLSNLLGGSS